LEENEEERKSRYEVGYRKPPRHGRFQKGRSGNPKGRPKKATGFCTIVQQQLEIRVEGKIATNKWNPKEICVKTKWYNELQNRYLGPGLDLCE